MNYLIRFGLVAMFLTLPGLARAQYCNPAVVNYLVRDEKGTLLDQEQLKLVQRKLPEAIDSARVNVDEVSFAEDGVSYYWPESVDYDKGRKQPTLQFVNAATCTMKLSEATITLHGKEMRLLFNVSIERQQRDRRVVIDSLPFQEGTFELDLRGWSHDPEKMIPATRWHKVKTAKLDVLLKKWAVSPSILSEETLILQNQSQWIHAS